MGKAISTLGRRRFPGPNHVSRWAVRRSQIPDDYDALILLHVEELGVNELRETFHHWIRTLAYPCRNGELGEALSHQPAIQLRDYQTSTDQSDKEKGADILADIEVDLKDEVKRLRNQLTSDLVDLLKTDGKKAVDDENDRFASRQGEVSELIANLSVKRLEREISQLKTERAQVLLFDDKRQLDLMDRDIQAKEDEVRRRREHYEEVREQLAKERERIINRMLPKRYALYGEAQVFPLTVEIRLPGG